MDAVGDWRELITLVIAVVALCLSVVSALASWRSATAARDSAAIAKATRQPFIDVIEWFNVTLKVSEPPQLPPPADRRRTPDKLIFYGRIQELAGIPTKIHRARIRYSPGIAKPGEYRDITLLTGVGSKVSTHVMFKEHVPALICEEFDTIIADFGMGFHTLPTSVGRVELELTISAVGNKDVYVWNIEALVFYHGIKNGTHSVDLRGLPPVLVSERQQGSGP